MRKWTAVFFLAVLLSGCKRYEPVTEIPNGGQDKTLVDAASSTQEVMQESIPQAAETSAAETPEEETTAAQEETPITISTTDKRPPVKVKGIYVSAYVAGTKSMMDEIIDRIEQTEINAVVIDVKDDNGKVTFNMDSPLVTEIDACEAFIPDIDGLVKRLKDKDIYLIARIPAFRDPYLAEAMPQWCCKLADGSIYRDSKGLAWVNPYKQEVWDYLMEISKSAKAAGFDEIQFDYIRFSTEKGMRNVVFDEADTKGRGRQEIIQEFVQYAYEILSKEGLYVSADVFGAIMGGGQDAETVGQDYVKMAGSLDYICPMIYPSHYGDGNFGIDHPDTKPYETILAALQVSREDLAGSEAQSAGKTAVVRPWLQSFTAKYLKNHIEYGPEQIRAQIQAVYDAGYDEWILWNASVKYPYEGLLTPQQAQEEQQTAESESEG